jgi:hypothetical protein
MEKEDQLLGYYGYPLKGFKIFVTQVPLSSSLSKSEVKVSRSIGPKDKGRRNIGKDSLQPKISGYVAHMEVTSSGTSHLDGEVEEYRRDNLPMQYQVNVDRYSNNSIVIINNEMKEGLVSIIKGIVVPKKMQIEGETIGRECVGEAFIGRKIYLEALSGR